MKLGGFDVPYSGVGLLGGGGGGILSVLVGPFLAGNLGLIWIYGLSLVVLVGLGVVWDGLGAEVARGGGCT